MANQIPPVPVNSPNGSFAWQDWLNKLRNFANNSTTNHNDLTGIQGGSTGEYYHLTLAEKNAIANIMSINRVVRGVINILNGNTSQTYTLSPAVSSMDKAELRLLGIVGGTGTITNTFAYIELTNTSTITAYRGGNGGTDSISFELTEYN